MGDLSQARIVVVSEPTLGARLEEAQIKRVTGGEPITARPVSNDLEVSAVDFAREFSRLMQTRQQRRLP